MADPITGGSRRWQAEPATKELTDREKKREAKRRENQKRREAERNVKKAKANTTDRPE